MTKLRLLLSEKCNRNCAGCCNKTYDLDALPVCPTLEGWDEVLLTGGEPMLDPDLVIQTAFAVPTGTNVFLYTAKVDDIPAALEVSRFVSGFTITLHEQSDVEPFLAFALALSKEPHHAALSKRLNVFQGVEFPTSHYSLLNRWIIKPNMIWIEDCPLPSDETFMRLNHHRG